MDINSIPINKSPLINIITRPGKVSLNTNAPFFTNNTTFTQKILLKKKFDIKRGFKYIKLFEEMVGIYKFGHYKLKINI